MLRDRSGEFETNHYTVKYLKQAADQGEADAQCLLGTMCFKEGLWEKAVMFYQLAANQRDMYAQYNLAIMYENGLGVTQNNQKAVEYYKLSADQGFADAQYILGVRHKTQDNQKAFDYFTLAADQGHADAQYKLGKMYKKRKRS